MDEKKKERRYRIKRLKALVKESGLTAQMYSSLLDVKVNTMRNYMCGANAIPEKYLERAQKINETIKKAIESLRNDGEDK